MMEEQLVVDARPLNSMEKMKSQPFIIARQQNSVRIDKEIKSPVSSVKSREQVCKKIVNNSSKPGSTSLQKDGHTFEPTLILHPG